VPNEALCNRRGVSSKLFLDMTSEGLGDMFEGDIVDTWAKFVLPVSMGGRGDPSSRRN
jgi:hypothetical protein